MIRIPTRATDGIRAGHEPSRNGVARGQGQGAGVAREAQEAVRAARGHGMAAIGLDAHDGGEEKVRDYIRPCAALREARRRGPVEQPVTHHTDHEGKPAAWHRLVRGYPAPTGGFRQKSDEPAVHRSALDSRP